ARSPRRTGDSSLSPGDVWRVFQDLLIAYWRFGWPFLALHFLVFVSFLRLLYDTLIETNGLKKWRANHKAPTTDARGATRDSPVPECVELLSQFETERARWRPLGVLVPARDY